MVRKLVKIVNLLANLVMSSPKIRGKIPI